MGDSDAHLTPHQNIHCDYRRIGFGHPQQHCYHRLNVVTIQIPPLRERKADLEKLVSYFVQRYSSELNIDTPMVSEEALNVIRSYDWPGNVLKLDGLSLPLGVDGNADMQRSQEQTFDPGSLLSLATDGVFEATSEQGEQFGIKRALESVLSNRNLSAAAIAKCLESDVRKFCHDGIKDDVTIVITKYLEPCWDASQREETPALHGFPDTDSFSGSRQ